MGLVAHIERIPWPVGIIRVGADGWQFGEPYIAASVLIYSRPEPEIAALTMSPSFEMWREVARLLAREGLDGAMFRRADGRTGWLRARVD